MLHCYLYISAKLSANWNNLALKIQIRCDVCSTVYTKYVHTLKKFWSFVTFPVHKFKLKLGKVSAQENMLSEG